jgi:hypothetical protein
MNKGRLRRNRRFLIQLAETKTRKQRKQLFEKAGKEPVACCVEIVSNFLEKKIPLSRTQVNKLKPYAKHIRRISKHRSVTVAKKDLIGHGAFLGPLLAPVLATLASKLIEHAIDHGRSKISIGSRNGNKGRRRRRKSAGEDDSEEA